MRYLAIIAGVCAALVMVSPAYAGDMPASAAQPTDPVAEIIAAEREMERIYNLPEFAKDPTILHRFFAPDITLYDIMEPGRFQGAAAIKHADELGVTFLGRVVFENMNVTADDDFGYVEYIQNLVGKTADGAPYDLKLFATDIWRKSDGTWKLIHQHVSLPMDLATFAKVMAPK